MEQYILDLVKRVKLLILDVDGVLTDGRMVYNSSGEDIKFFDVHDGMGVHLLKKAGINTAIITAKGSRAIGPRAKDMQIEDVFEDISPKTKVLDKILKKYSLSPDEACFIGDDLVDICIMKEVGFPVAVFNARPEIKRVSSYVTLKEGGKGAVREVAELILKSNGKWEGLLKEYGL